MHSIIDHQTRHIQVIKMESVSDDNCIQRRQPVRDRQQGSQVSQINRMIGRVTPHIRLSDIVSVFQSPLDGKACRA